MLFSFTLLVACTEAKDYADIDAPLDCSSFLTGFEAYADLVDVACTETHLHLDTVTGLPHQHPSDIDNQMMIGIENWIQRVPIPYGFEWEIPMDPAWLNTRQETTGVGPIAVAVNGVPIFHFEKRPSTSINPDEYDANSDTVATNELDQCGGHAGQGEDYHYHYAPICLLDNHDLSQPIAFSLDGAPIYYGTGGDNFFGRGRYNDWNNLPEGSTESLNECNAHQRDDGSYVYYTTAEPPYVLGCHMAEFNTANQINVPFGGRSQGTNVPYGTEAGEPLATHVTAFSVDIDSGIREIQFDNTGETSAWTYVQSNAQSDCWEFTFMETVGDTGTTETYCR